MTKQLFLSFVGSTVLKTTAQLGRNRRLIVLVSFLFLLSISGIVLTAPKGPSVTVNQAAGQTDPTNSSSINFTVVFSSAVTGFTNADVTISGTAGGTKTVVVTGSGASYNVAVSGMSSSGTVIATIGTSVAQDSSGNGNRASNSTDNSVTYDVTKPSVTINQASGQSDPTSASTLNFTVVFNEVVTGFTNTDVVLSSTAGATNVVVTGSGSTYNVAVSGMTTSGTVLANIPAGAAQDALSNLSNASTSTDNSVTYDGTKPAVTINQASGQADPTTVLPVNFTVIFSEAVTGFTNTDVTLSGTAGAITAVVTGSGTTYNVAVGGMTTNGTVIASIPAGAAQDAAGNTSNASTSTDNSILYSITAFSVMINQAPGQADPTNAATINFTAVFSRAVTGFTGTDVLLSGTANGQKRVVVTGSGTIYNVAISKITNGTVIATIPAGAAQDASGNISPASTSTDNSVTYDTVSPTVTINQQAGQTDPTNSPSVNFTVVFNEPVTGFTNSNVTLSGTAGPSGTTVTGSGTTYNVAVSGMIANGSIVASIPTGAAQDLAGNNSTASTSTDNSVAYDATAPIVTINQGSGQSDPTKISTVNFTVVFSEIVTGLTNSDVTLSGTAGATTAVVTGSGTTYNVAVTGMTADGNVVATVPAGAAQDAAGNGNAAATSTDNSVAYDATAPAVTINRAAGETDPTNAATINFTVVFSESVSDFAGGDVTLAGTAGATNAVVTGNGTTYNVAVSGMTADGTITASLAAGVAHDQAGNGSTISTSTDNSITYDVTAPSVTIDLADGQPDPTNLSTVNFRVLFSEPVTGFATGDVMLSGTAGASLAVVTGTGTTYNVAVSGMAGDGAIVATVPAAVAADAAGNVNTASTSSHNSASYDATAPTVTINQAADQLDPTKSAPVNFMLNFSEPVSGFTAGDVTLRGTAGATTVLVTGDGAAYNLAVSGMTADGTVIASLAANVVQDAAGNSNTASTTSDNSISYDATPPTVTINQASGQTDPAISAPISFMVVFSEPVTGFADQGVTLSGTAGATTALVTGSGTNYNVTVSGMSGNGTVIASIPVGVAQDVTGNNNTASTSSDNSITYSPPDEDPSPTPTPDPSPTPTPTPTPDPSPTPTPTPDPSPTPAPSPVNFAVIGDFGCACGPELDVANLVKSWNPDFIATTGDNNYPLGEASTIDSTIGQYYHGFIYPYVGTYGAGADINRFFPSIGNHDWGDGFITPPTIQPYTNYFSLPNNERYYDIAWGSVHLFFIDSDGYEPDGNTSTSIQANWLQSRLAAATEPWKLVYFHHPPYSSGSHGPTAVMQWPFESWGATAVLNGHDHLYERVTQGNFVYFVNGLGGASRDAVVRTPPPGSQVRYFADHGAMLVNASSDSIVFQFITRTGTLIDTYTIYSNPAAHEAAAPSNLTATTNCGTQITLAWADNASNEDGYEIEQSADGTNFTQVNTVAANQNTYLSTNLSPSTTYYYRVKAYNTLGDTVFSNIVNATTSSTSANDPSNLTAATNSSSRINLTWTDNICSELGFKIERSSDGVSFAQIATVAANVTSYLNTGLPQSTGYYYRVRAYDAQGDSDYSNVAFGVSGPPAPPAPTSLSANPFSATQINLSWVDNSTDEDAFRIYRSSDGVSFFWYYTAGANATTFSDTGRAASTTYYYRVTAHNPGGESPQSNTASATTFPPPAAPSNLTATAISASRIDLSWTDNSSDEDGFKIYRSTDNVNFAFYASVGANVTTRSNTNLTSATTYYYRVLAYNAGGSSGYSNVANATTLSLPAVPSNLSATAVSPSQINLSWTDNSNDESNFRIYRSTDGVTFIWYYTPAANVTSYADTSRTAGTTYYYRLQASNANGNSDFSNTANATTFPVPAAPSNLTATTISSSRIDLAWVDNSSGEDGFKIYRSTDGVNFVFYATVGANVTTRSNTNLTSSTTYYYRVFAYNSGGNSGNSNVASATTLP